MYLPATFRENSPEAIQNLIGSFPLGTLVTHGPEGLDASPVPFILYAEEGEHGTLRAHMARANPHWKVLAASLECLVVFTGDQGYITPSWYANKAISHKVVPTWNYATVHAWGTPKIIDDPAWLYQQLRDLTALQENSRRQPWAITDAPEDYIATQMKAIIGLEIPITRIEGKWKMSQNREKIDQQGVIAGLEAKDDPHGNPLLADLVREYTEKI